MDDTTKELNDKLATLFARGEEVLEALRSQAQEAAQSQEALLRDARPLFDEVDIVVEKLGIGDVVRPALELLSSAWLGVLQREVRYFELLREIEATHEELFAVVAKGTEP